MRLSDFKGEEALDVLADIIEPLTAILSDKEIQEMGKNKKTPVVKFVKPILKSHKKELIEVLARLNRKTVEEYEEEISLATLPMQVLELVNDPEVKNLFRSQGESKLTPSASSSPAMANTEAKGN